MSTKHNTYTHYYMVDPDTKIELPRSTEEFISEIKRCIKEVSKIGAIISFKQGQEIGFFSLSGMGKLSPIQEMQLREYLLEHPAQ